MYKNILLEQSGQIATITINRPEVYNALNAETLGEMANVLERLEKDDNTGCVLFTGQGEKSFASGADIRQLKEKTGLDVFSGPGMQQIYDYIENYSKPTIAMINGYALGGGLELAMACDIRIASVHAKLGLPELNLSIIPGAGGTQRLARLVGKGKALEMILTGKIIDAEEALNFGLVSEVTEQLKETAFRYAENILSKGPLAVKFAKIAVNYGTEVDMRSGQLIERLVQAILMNTEDKLEGTAAFLEKRKPNFQGK